MHGGIIQAVDARLLRAKLVFVGGPADSVERKRLSKGIHCRPIRVVEIETRKKANAATRRKEEGMGKVKVFT